MRIEAEDILASRVFEDDGDGADKSTSSDEDGDEPDEKDLE